MAIRPAELSDASAILELLRQSPGSAQWSEAQLGHALARDVVLVAFSPTGALLGCVVARAAGAEWELDNLAVVPAFRRRGIARHLLRELLRQAQGAGAEALFLEVRASNRAARALYEAAGFCRCGRRRGYYSDPQEDAVLYRIGLDCG
jgi:ribosomal-protein-alanine acetyltransferase